MADPLLEKIKTGLDQLSDGDRFEACANALLSGKYPTLTWVKGGNDAGFDGKAVVKQGRLAQLITTVDDDVIGNVTKSLKRAAEENEPSDIVIVATSRQLSPQRKRNISARIAKFGKQAYPIEDQATIAERLYRDSRWRIELLGITGNPPPLSSFPVSDRPILRLELIGRSAELAALSKAAGDLILCGQPGSGKSCLLAEAARTTNGVFLVETDRGIVADGIRDQQPAWIVVDDAFSRKEQLLMLRQIRHDIGASFRIVASCWPGQEADVAATLDARTMQPVVLEALPQPQIKDIVVAAGLSGPNDLLAEVIHQANGKPGLAVTLAELCASDNFRDVITGRALASDIKRSLERLAGSQAVQLLGFFSLSGSAGLTIEDAAKLAELAPGETRRCAELMGASGVLETAQERRIVVQPARLRQALVAETFCGSFGLDWTNFLKSVPDEAETVLTICCAALLGGKWDDGKIQTAIEALTTSRFNLVEICRCYARLGREQSLWLIGRFPEMLEQIGDSVLPEAPDVVIPLLLDADHNANDPVPDFRKRLKLIQQWIDDVAQTRETVVRRKELLSALLGARQKLGSSETLLAGVDKVLGLRFERMSAPAGRPDQMVITWGAIPVDFLSEIAAMWPQILPLLAGLPANQIHLLQFLVGEWVRPKSITDKVSAEFEAETKKWAVGMMHDLLKSYAEEWAVLRKLQPLAQDVGITVPPPLNRIAAVLYPDTEIEEAIVLTPVHDQAVNALVAEWVAIGPMDSLLDEWIEVNRQAAEADLHHNPAEAAFIHRLASAVPHPVTWVQPMLSRRLGLHFVYFLVIRACTIDPVFRQAFLRDYREDELYQRLALECLLRFTTPSDTDWAQWATIIRRYPSDVGTAVLRDQVCEEGVSRLLQDSDPKVRRETAAHLWSAQPRGVIPPNLFDAWREAVINDLDDDHEWDSIAPAHPDLACGWLKKRILRIGFSYNLGGIEWNHYLPAIVAALSPAQKREVLDLIPQDSIQRRLVASLVGVNVALLRHALSRPAISALALSTLGFPSRKNKDWPKRAIAMLDAGFTPKEVYLGSMGFGDGWQGSGAAHAESRRKEYLRFANHKDPRLCAVCEMGVRHYAEEHDRLAKAERGATVKGALS